MPELSVIIPVKNEEKNIAALIAAIQASLAGIDYELLVVDDGSEDNTDQEVLDNADHCTTLIALQKNYGQSAAIRAGIDHAFGRYVVMLDGDLQNDPSDIPAMLSLLKKGEWDMVAGNRKNRQDGFLLRKIPSSIANALIRCLTGIRLRDFGCTLRVFKKEFATGLGLHGEYHRFIPLLTHIQGARITQVDVKHHHRIHGQSKYGLSRTFKVLRDLPLMIYLSHQRSNKKTKTIIAAFCIALLLISGVFLSISSVTSGPVNLYKLVPGTMLLTTGILLIRLAFILKRKAADFRYRQKQVPYSIRQIHRPRN